MDKNEWYLYMIRCADNALYTGITTDVEKRFQAHVNGKGAKFLRGKKSLELVFFQWVGNHSSALKLESKVKKLNKKSKEKIITNGRISFS